MLSMPPHTTISLIPSIMDCTPNIVAFVPLAQTLFIPVHGVDYEIMRTSGIQFRNVGFAETYLFNARSKGGLPCGMLSATTADYVPHENLLHERSFNASLLQRSYGEMCEKAPRISAISFALTFNGNGAESWGIK
jgi:hypothetical protein